jgi:phenylalanyl-tRNA synthetase beta chain
VYDADGVLIERVDVFDFWEVPGIPEGKKSLAAAILRQPKDCTLADAEIESVARRLVAAVSKATGGTLRM